MAVDGGEAIEHVERERPRLIVLDLLMPAVDGFAVVEQLRQRPAWSTIPVVVVTAADLTVDDRARLSGQVQRIVAKGGYGLAELAGVVRQASDGPAPVQPFGLKELTEKLREAALP